MVRLWSPGQEEAPLGPEIRGVVQHVRSGQEARFAGPEELLAFLSRPRSPASEGGAFRAGDREADQQ